MTAGIGQATGGTLAKPVLPVYDNPETAAAHSLVEGVLHVQIGVVMPVRKPEMRSLRIKHHWTGEQLKVLYKVGNRYQPRAMAKINHFMRDWRCKKSTRMDPALIDRLYELQQSIGPKKTIRLISAYRSEGYNASLLRAGRTVDPDSQHMFGRAVDVFVRGVSLPRLKEAADELPVGGLGYYPFSGPRFVHIDTGPKRNWAEMDPGKRRKLGLPKRPRKRLKLDCSLTMAEVLKDVPVGEVLAALPAGASVNPAAKLHRASYIRTHAEERERRQGAKAKVQGMVKAAINTQSHYSSCEAGKTLAVLEPLKRR